MDRLDAWLWEVSVAGVDHKLEGNGGEDCLNYLPWWQRRVESLLLVPAALAALIWARARLSTGSGGHVLGQHGNAMVTMEDASYRSALLTLYSLVFGAELAYKMISRTALFILNPCHLATIAQLFLLATRPDGGATANLRAVRAALFRLHMYVVPGALVALTFPILNTRLLPGEVLIYYVQHALILVVPIYILHTEGSHHQTTGEGKWSVAGMALLIVYHFWPLQSLAERTLVNLNNILCPAVSDPFRGRFYRLIAVSHQCLIVPILVRVHYSVSAAVSALLKSSFHSALSSTAATSQQQPQNCAHHTNGHAKKAE